MYKDLTPDAMQALEIAYSEENHSGIPFEIFKSGFIAGLRYKDRQERKAENDMR